MTIKYKLSEGEQLVATAIAGRRLENNMSVDKQYDKKQTGRDEYRNLLDSFGAELTVCRMFDTYPDFSTHINPGHWDLVVDDLTVDVKWAPEPFHNLIAHPSKAAKDKRCDIYVLVTGMFPDYTVRGWCWAEDLFQPENITELSSGKDKPYLMKQKDLQTFFLDDSMKKRGLRESSNG